jgi:hypothetical protein
MDSRVPVEFLDEYEELDPFDTYGYTVTPTAMNVPTYGVSHFQQLCKLTTLADHILLHLYAEKSSEKASEELYRVAQSLQIDLEQWHNSLPPHFAFRRGPSGDLGGVKGSIPLPHALSLL